MPTPQGDVRYLDDPVAQRLLRSTIPARLSYVWTDGTPRVIPIIFHWNGESLVFGTPPDAPKMHALGEGSRVAATIDSDEFPYHVLQLRGSVHTDVVDGIAPEYEAATLRCLGDEAGRAWLANMRPLCPQMARIFLTPDWVGILDFQTRFPSAVERAIEQAQAASEA